jgi:hypothetical protein
MIMIRRSARYRVDREDVGGEKYNSAYSHYARLVFANFHPVHNGTPASVTERPLPYHTFMNIILYFKTNAID